MKEARVYPRGRNRGEKAQGEDGVQTVRQEGAQEVRQESAQEAGQETAQEAGQETAQEARSEGRREARREGREAKSHQEGRQAPAERGLHDACASGCHTRRCRRRIRVAAHRTNEKDLGLHQAQRATGPTEPWHDQRRRQAPRGVRRRAAGEHVPDDVPRESTRHAPTCSECSGDSPGRLRTRGLSALNARPPAPTAGPWGRGRGRPRSRYFFLRASRDLGAALLRAETSASRTERVRAARRRTLVAPRSPHAPLTGTNIPGSAWTSSCCWAGVRLTIPQPVDG